MTQEDMQFFESLFRSLEREMDRRFDQMETRFDAVNARLDDIAVFSLAEQKRTNVLLEQQYALLERHYALLEQRSESARKAGLAGGRGRKKAEGKKAE